MLRVFIVSLLLLCGAVSQAHAHGGHAPAPLPLQPIEQVSADNVFQASVHENCCHSGVNCVTVGHLGHSGIYQSIQHIRPVAYHPGGKYLRTSLAWQPPTPPPILAV